jgi:hypothetical protein
MVATESSAGIPRPTIHVKWDVGSYYIDHLIEEENKSEGRKKKCENL